jgi:hypothetical protein
MYIYILYQKQIQTSFFLCLNFYFVVPPGFKSAANLREVGVMGLNAIFNHITFPILSVAKTYHSPEQTCDIFNTGKTAISGYHH